MPLKKKSLAHCKVNVQRRYLKKTPVYILIKRKIIYKKKNNQTL